MVQKLCKSILFLVTCLYAVANVTGQNTAPIPTTQPPSFTLTIKTPSRAFRLGEDVLLYLVFTNTTDHDIYFTRAPGYNNPEFSYHFSILNEKGENKESRYSASIHDPSVLHHGSQAMDILKPGADLEMKAHLNRIADLDKPGHYTVQISRNDRASGRMITSNKIVVDIVDK